MATLYWGGNFANWSDTTKWYTDEDLVTPAGAKPTTADDVIFNANAPGDCTIDENAIARTINLEQFAHIVYTQIVQYQFGVEQLDGDVSDMRNIGGNSQWLWTAITAGPITLVFSMPSSGADNATSTVYAPRPHGAHALGWVPKIVGDILIDMKGSNQQLVVHSYDQGTDPDQQVLACSGNFTIRHSPSYAFTSDVQLYGSFESDLALLLVNNTLAGTIFEVVLWPPATPGVALREGVKCNSISVSTALGTNVEITVKDDAQLTLSAPPSATANLDLANLDIIGEDGSLVEIHAARTHKRTVTFGGTETYDFYDLTFRDVAGVGGGAPELLQIIKTGGGQLFIRNKLQFKATLGRFAIRLPDDAVAPSEGAGYAWIAANSIEVQGRGTRCGIGGAVNAEVWLYYPYDDGPLATISAETDDVAPEYAAFKYCDTTKKSKNDIDGVEWDCGSATVTDGVAGSGTGTNNGMVFVGTDWAGCPDWPVDVDDELYVDPWPAQPKYSFAAVMGGALPVQQVITVTPEPGSLEELVSLSLETVLPAWLNVGIYGSANLRYITLSPNTTALAPGVYTAEIDFKVPNAIHAQRTFSIEYTLTAVPEFEFSADPAIIITKKQVIPAATVVEVLNKYPLAGEIPCPITLGATPAWLEATFVEDRVGARVGWIYLQPTQLGVDQDRGVYVTDLDIEAGDYVPGSSSSCESSSSAEWPGLQGSMRVELVIQATILSAAPVTLQYVSGTPDPIVRVVAENIGDFTMKQIAVFNFGAWLTLVEYGGSGNDQWADLQVDVASMFGSPPAQAEYISTIDIAAEDAYIPGQAEPTDEVPLPVAITIEWVESPLFVATPAEVNFVPGEDWSFPAPTLVHIDCVRGTPFEAIEVITTDPSYPIPPWLLYVLNDDAPDYVNQELLLTMIDIPLSGDVADYYSTLKIRTRSNVDDPAVYAAEAFLYLPVNIVPPAYLIRDGCYIPYVRRIEGVLVDTCDVPSAPAPVFRCCPSAIPGPAGPTGPTGPTGPPGR